jgi:large subunit ribosomal protein L28
MAKCDICGKGPQFGHNVSHSMRHTKRTWKANMQRARVLENGVEKHVHICTRCIKTRQKTA